MVSRASESIIRLTSSGFNIDAHVRVLAKGDDDREPSAAFPGWKRVAEPSFL
jgi:hypothetical protein